MSGAAGGPPYGGPSGTLLAPQLASYGGGSPHPGGGGSRVPEASQWVKDQELPVSSWV